MEKPFSKWRSTMGMRSSLMNETAELQKILEDNPDFDKLMKHPGIPKQEKLSMVETGFPGQGKRRSGRIFEDRGDQGTLRFIKGNFCLFYRTGQRIGRNGNRICKYRSGADEGTETGSERKAAVERLLISPLMCITMWIRH